MAMNRVSICTFQKNLNYKNICNTFSQCCLNADKFTFESIPRVLAAVRERTNSVAAWVESGMARGSSLML